MDIDASQYAEISREMMKSGDYLHVFDRGMEYLDKPPFLFWVSAASMRIFGVNNFGYKLPSLLFALWALWATYRLGRLLYGDVTGRMAALVLATCQGMMLMANDIRCDTILMSWVITSVWMLREWLQNGRIGYMLGAFAAAAFGMMTKGPIALMVPVFCFSADWALKRQWGSFFRPQYLIGLLLMAVLLVPMSIGLYQQFDMHPEKVVNGATGISGLRFFYWSQSFGRITGESPWKNNVYPTFLLENMLWSYLPWIVLFLPAMLLNVVTLVRQRLRLQPQQEWITTGGFFITYLALGSSAYQLPHYIFVVFPLAAIVTARFIYELAAMGQYRVLYAIFRPLYAFISGVLLLASLLLITYVFPAHPAYIALWVACLAVWLYLALKKDLAGKLLWLSAAAMIMANIFVTNHLYYTLLGYQAGSVAGRYIRSHALPTQSVVSYKMDDPLNCLYFYADGAIENIAGLNDLNGRRYVLAMDAGADSLHRQGYVTDTLLASSLFKVSELTPQFLNPKTRAEAIRHYYLLHIKAAP